jgi:hypothetical protein
VEIRKVNQEINSTLQHIAQIPGGVWAASMCVKDMESEFLHHGPNSQLQHLLEHLIGDLYEIKRVVGIIESHLNDMAAALGWTVDYDEDRDAYVVTGPCSEDWE